MNQTYDKNFKAIKSPTGRIEKENTRHFGSQEPRLHSDGSSGNLTSLDKLKKMYHSINPDDGSKYLSLKAIEDEENVTNLIRQQREKLESFKEEFKKKEIYCHTLEEEVKNLKKIVENSGKYQDLYQEALSKLKQNESYVEKFRNEKHHLEETNNKLQQQISFWKKECEKIQNTEKEAIEDLRELKKIYTEKEKVYKDQIANLLSKDQGTKEDSKQMKQELGKYKEYVEHLREKCSNLEAELKKVSAGGAKADRAEKAAEELKKELLNQKKEYEIRISKLFGDIKNLESANESQKELVAEQKASIQDLKQRIRDEESKYKYLKEENGMLTGKIGKLNEEKQALLESYNDEIMKSRELEKEVQKHRKEKTQLKKEVGRLHEKEHSEKKIKEELEKAKIDILSARNQEVQKLYETFESFFPGEGGNGSGMKGRTPSERGERDSYGYRMGQGVSTPKTDVSHHSEMGRLDKKRDSESSKRGYRDEAKSTTSSITKKKTIQIDTVN